MARLDRKLQVLRGEHLVVTEESRVNDELGESVAAQVSRLARPHEASKYRLHVEEVGKITSLLLGLSGRLARAENALMGLPHHHTERVNAMNAFLMLVYYSTFNFKAFYYLAYAIFLSLF
jgi:protein Shroom